MGLIIQLTLPVKKLIAFKRNRVANSDNTERVLKRFEQNEELHYLLQ